MIQSFRLRLALLSALLSGLALLAFGLGTWWLIRDLKLERIDREVRTQAEREASRFRSAAGWQQIETRLVASLVLRDSNDLLLFVEDASGEQLYRSPHWPAGLDVARLNWPKQGASSGNVSGFNLIGSAQAAELPVRLAQLGPEGRPPRRERPPLGGDFMRGDRPPRPDLNASDSPERPPRERNGEMEPPRRNTPTIPDRPAPSPTETSTPATLPPVAETVPERSPLAAPVDALPLREPLPARAEQPPFASPPASSNVTQNNDGHLWRIGLATTDRSRIAVAVDARSIDGDMKGIRNAFLVSMPLALVLIGLGSWVFSSRALRPLQKLTAATRRVTAEGLDQRIPGKGEDREFVELIEMFNRMLERLDRSFQQAHRFSADAAHELKTPLAILQGQLERAIHSVEDGAPIQAELTSILDEVRRLSTISRKLLLLSQADAGRLSLYRESFDLSKVLLDLVEDTRMLAPHLQIDSEIQPGLTLMADGSLLRQVLHNLISNAIKYNVENGWIRISTQTWPQRLEVLVSNASAGIPVGDRGKVFERFYRADPSHSRHVEGVGLGLSVSREIARAHGGDLSLRVAHDGSVQFSLLLPVQSHT